MTTRAPIRDRHLPRKDRVLNRWVAGWSLREIAADIGLSRPEAASVIVQRARRAGDPRAAVRHNIGRPTAKLFVSLTLPKAEPVADQLREEAESRGITVNELVERVLRHTAASKLFTAILD